MRDCVRVGACALGWVSECARMRVRACAGWGGAPVQQAFGQSCRGRRGPASTAPTSQVSSATLPALSPATGRSPVAAHSSAKSKKFGPHRLWPVHNHSQVGGSLCQPPYASAYVIKMWRFASNVTLCYTSRLGGVPKSAPKAKNPELRALQKSHLRSVSGPNRGPWGILHDRGKMCRH